MFVSRTMTRKVITLDQESSILDAQELMAENKIRHLPIIDKDRRLIGIITDRDIRSALPYNPQREPASEMKSILNLKVKDVM
ncbi:MAG: CBS domain-containing protein, partial [Desulfobacterales bacterium]